MAKNLTQKQKIGNLGEDIACKFLMKHGFEVMDRNYWKKWGEIDVVARKGEIIHFVEVKSVSRETLPGVFHETDEYRPEENVHPRKLARLRRVIQTYLIEKRAQDADWVFDVAIVYIVEDEKRARVKVLDDLVL